MNKEKTVKFLFVSMWITLILMVVLKLTFNYYYPIVIENSKLLEISKYIDEHVILHAIISYVLYIINCLFVCLCCIQEKWFKTRKDFIIAFALYTITYPIKISFEIIGSILVLVVYFIVPLIITKQPKRWILITFLLDNVFQILSNVARGNTIIAQNSYLIDTFLLIDYYLMFIIYYIGGIYMGWNTLLPWFTKKETVINAKIEKLQKKIKKLEEQKQCLKKQ